MNRRMKKIFLSGMITLAAMTGLFMQEASAVTFDSGSSCVNPADPKCLGAFSPAVNTVITLPDDGILDYTTFTIPYGVTVTFTKNAANTPVIIRTTGDVRIEGTISLSATSATNSGTYGDGNLGDDSQPGLGGPGGFDGGFGGYSTVFGGSSGRVGGAGNGPGGGGTGSGYVDYYGNLYGGGGGGGGFGNAGGGGASYGTAVGGAGGSTYGQASLLPLIGGSGGGGGSAGSAYSGSGGGGGGGAILIASSTTIFFGKSGQNGAGRIFADGGAGGNSAGSHSGGGGGGGGGGAIRLVANTLTGIQDRWMGARGGAGGDGWRTGGAGGAGRIRLEANTITGWDISRTDPAYSFGLPGHVLVPNSPTLAITSVTPIGGTEVPVPANPTGKADITFPTGTTSATVALAATNIPVGTFVTVYVVPASGAARSSAISPALAGTDASSTATATVTLSPGNNVLTASATYTITEIVAVNLPKFDGEMVAKVRVEGTMDGHSKVTYITASGREYPADAGMRNGSI